MSARIIPLHVGTGALASLGGAAFDNWRTTPDQRAEECGDFVTERAREKAAGVFDAGDSSDVLEFVLGDKQRNNLRDLVSAVLCRDVFDLECALDTLRDAFIHDKADDYVDDVREELARDAERDAEISCLERCGP